MCRASCFGLRLGPLWVVFIRWMSAIGAAAGPFPTRWNSRRQRHVDLVRESRLRYPALQLHRMIEGATS